MSILPPSLPALLSGLSQSTLLLGAGWLFYYLVLRRERCFHYNRRFLLLVPWLALAFPLLLGVVGPEFLPAWALPTNSPLLAGGLLPTVQITAQPGGLQSFSDNALSTALLLYGAVALLLLIRLAVQALWVWLSTRHWPRQEGPGYTLVHTGGQRPVSSYGKWVFWDETTVLSPAEAEAILAHEVAHVRQGHSRERLLLEVARALLWVCPLVHLFPRALALTHEFLADEAALRQPQPAATTPEAYASLLARTALGQFYPRLPLTHSFTQSFTLTRIHMLTSTSPVRRWKQWLALPLGVALLFTVACEKAAEQPTASSKPTAVSVSSSHTLSSQPGAPYFYVENMPVYGSGQEQLLQDLGSQLKYPTEALLVRLEGRVFIKFVVGSDGTLQDFDLQKGIKAPKGQEAAAQAMNEAALQAVRSLPGKWTPGTQGGKPVAVSYTVPINFVLQKARVNAPGNYFMPIMYPAPQC
ncbi:TonB family protein [Hymenobacter sediminis]|uniref:TonB family protein n=1 Tax=Hymenobacter sediminis TaxID=2218621 RepID=UPI00138FC169|nr:M56 family metallopeptidase [Hymenobacter sediminis]